MTVCVSCGAPVTGEYCAACGERTRPHDLSLRGFLGESLEALTNLDARGLRTFRTLFRRPGLLTREYVAGRRRTYLSPIHVFLIANVLFFFVHEVGLPVPNFASPLGVHVRHTAYGDLARSLWEERLAEDRRNVVERSEQLARDTTSAGRVNYTAFAQDSVERRIREPAALRARFDVTSEQHAKTFLILFAPLFALAIALLRIRRGEPAGHHMAFALHLLAFALLLFIAASFIIEIIRRAMPGGLTGDNPIIPVFVIGSLAVWVIAAVRTAYGSTIRGAVLQGLLLALLFIPLLGLFRFLLFFTVLYTI